MKNTSSSEELCVPAPTIWHPGSPPFAGWWNASRSGNPDSWRWWDGWRWSWSCLSNLTPVEAASRAQRRLTVSQSADIRWTWAWPEGAATQRKPPRVPPQREAAGGPWHGNAARLWRTGPPPHAGWWNAATRPRRKLWRFWNGRHFSAPAHEGASPEEAARIAAIPAKARESIRWTTRWPKRARFKRPGAGTALL